MSVCSFVHPPICIENLGSRWMDFYEIRYLRTFRKSVHKIQVSLKFNKNIPCFTRRPIYVYDHMSLKCSYKEDCFRTSCRENQTHQLCSTTFCLKSCRL
jgi:hypothetical protein